MESGQGDVDAAIMVLEERRAGLGTDGPRNREESGEVGIVSVRLLLYLRR